MSDGSTEQQEKQDEPKFIAEATPQGPDQKTEQETIEVEEKEYPDREENLGPLKYVHSRHLPDLWRQLNMTLVVTTYQAGKVLLVRPGQEKLNMLMRNFPKPMGIALGNKVMALGTRNQVWMFTNMTDLHDEEGKPVEHDRFFVPRTSTVTGDMAIHEMCWGRSDNPNALNQAMLWIVNTRFSCLCTLDQQYSFRPIWRPPFITQLAPEDRCHLNGMAMHDGRPRFVSMLGTTDVKQGWRENKAHGGCIMDIASGEMVTTGMSMPHSPRLYNNRLYVLESGLGELQWVDIKTGKRETVAKLPGYTRGLAFRGPLAFVGLSKIREKREFGGLQIEDMYDELECSVHVVNLETGQSVGAIRFDSGCTELFDVQVMPGVTNPEVVGFAKDTINGIFLVPPHSW